MSAGTALAALALTGAIGLAMTSDPTLASWTAAEVVNSTDTAKSGRLAFTHTYPGGTCSATGPTDPVECVGGPVATGAATSTAQDVSDTLQNSSTGGSAFEHQVQAAACAPAQFADARGSNADPMLARYRVTRGVTDKWGGSGAASFDGTNDYAADIVATSTVAWAESDFTIGVWFKAAPGSAGGGLLSLNASPTSTSTSGANPTLYVEPGGRIHFKSDGVLGARQDVAGTTDLRDGSWHLAVVSTDRGLLSTDIRLYVDGVLVGSRLGISLLTGTFSDSYWHLGWTDTTLLQNSPPNHFTGALSGAFVHRGSALGGPAIASLAGASSAAAYSSALSAATHVWMLDDAATSTFSGSVPYIGGGVPCSEVRLAWTLGPTTAFAATRLDLLVGAGWLPAVAAVAPTVGSSQTLVTSYSRDTSYDVDVTGMELVTGLRHRVALVGATAWLLELRWSSLVLLG